MTTLLLICWLVLAAALVLHQAVSPVRSPRSWFELTRRDEQPIIRRERMFASITAIRRLAELFLIILLTTIALVVWQAWGVLAVIVLVIVSMLLASVAPLRKYASRLYTPLESRLMDAIDAYPFLKSVTYDPNYAHHDQRIESPEHLRHLVEGATGSVLDDAQRTIIINALSWHSIPVADVMTERSAIVSIPHTELLGPLVLNDLHATGHSRFPVIKGDIDTVVGMLDITSLLEIDAGKRSSTAEKAMTAHILRIESQELLPAALAALQRNRLHSALVVDTQGKTVGIVTLSDVMDALIGRRRHA